jgi:signal transduction histidine kinase
VTLSARTRHLGDDCGPLLGSVQAGVHVEITIADSGAGISPEVRDRLFRELFVTTKPRHRGLGLALVYRVLETFACGLCFDAVDDGTTVRLLVPTKSPSEIIDKT